MIASTASASGCNTITCRSWSSLNFSQFRHVPFADFNRPSTYATYSRRIKWALTWSINRARDSGFIAAAAALASQDANFVLIPEIPLTLEGEGGFLAALQRRILTRRHALIAVAEGAGQNLFSGENAKDASGNILHQDIGLFLKDAISRHFKEQKIPVTLKYIDPSYIIRSVPANSEDAVLCDQFARNAVHAAMAGKTDFIVGFWNSFTLLPILAATAKRQQVQPNGFLWRSVISATGQPSRWE